MLLLLTLVGAGFWLAKYVIQMDASLGTPETVTEPEVLTRASERLIQLTQWTISTILIIGGGLIGLNWYQNQRRYEQDKDDLLREKAGIEERIGDVEDAFEARVQRLEKRMSGHLEELLNTYLADLEAAYGPSETYAAIAAGYAVLREEEAPATFWTSLFLEEGVRSLFAELEDPTESVAVGDRAGLDRYRAFWDEVSQEFPEFKDDCQDLRRRVAIIAV
jgi:hypothetical protein